MVELVSPYAEEGMWLRGNLHAHSTNSDGVRAPNRVVEDYAARGYDFIAISDHDTFTVPTETALEAGIVELPAVEVSANGPHTLHIGATEVIPPHEDQQKVVDAVHDDGGVVVAAHPNWQAGFSHWPQAELEQITGFTGIEIYNGLIEHHPGAAIATDRWDQLLSAGRRVWGFANDDSHRPWEVAQGWNVVQAEERTLEAITEALATGRFYASTGVTVKQIDISGAELTIETADADRIRLITDHGVVQQTVSGSTATFIIPEQLVYREEHEYVRIECAGRGGDMAWLQPFFLE